MAGYLLKMSSLLERWRDVSIVYRCCSAETSCIVLLAYYWRITGVLLLGALADRC